MTEDRALRGGDWRNPRSAAPFDWLGGALAWAQPAVAHPRWELSRQGKAIATVHRHGVLVSRWDVEGPSGVWWVRRDWRGRRWIGRAGAREAAVRYEPAWRSGRITLGDATRLTWKRLGFAREWVVANDEGFPFVRLRARTGGFRFEGEVEFDVSARRLDDPEPLVMLGWILLVEARRRRRAL